MNPLSLLHLSGVKPMNRWFSGHDPRFQHRRTINHNYSSHFDIRACPQPCEEARGCAKSCRPARPS